MMMLLMIWLSSIFMIMALGIVTVYSLVLVAWVWEKYDSNRETIVLVAGILLSFLMVLWFFFFMRMGKKIELIFLLFKIAGTAMWNNMRMMLYGPVVSTIILSLQITLKHDLKCLLDFHLQCDWHSTVHIFCVHCHCRLHGV